MPIRSTKKLGNFVPGSLRDLLVDSLHLVSIYPPAYTIILKHAHMRIHTPPCFNMFILCSLVRTVTGRLTDVSTVGLTRFCQSLLLCGFCVSLVPDTVLLPSPIIPGCRKTRLTFSRVGSFFCFLALVPHAVTFISRRIYQITAIIKSNNCV